MDINLLNALDTAIDASFAASLAGLSLAAAAFFAPAAGDFVKEKSTKLLALEREIEHRHYPDGSPISKERDALQRSIDQVSDAQKGLLKSFIILVFLVAYSVSIDQLVGETVFSDFRLRIVDVSTSALLLGLAGWKMWVGAQGIGSYFNVDFESEKKKLEEIREGIRRRLAE